PCAVVIRDPPIIDAGYGELDRDGALRGGDPPRRVVLPYEVVMREPPPIIDVDELGRDVVIEEGVPPRRVVPPYEVTVRDGELMPLRVVPPYAVTIREPVPPYDVR